MIIGIVGPSASGKTSLARTIVNELSNKRIAIISADSYYKPFYESPLSERMKINFDHPDSLDMDLLTEHLDILQKGQGIEMPIYDFSSYTRLPETVSINPHEITVLEGILLFAHAPLRDKMNIRIFIDTPMDICLLRRIQRDIIERGRTVESVLEQYEKNVRPMYQQFILPYRTYADIIIPRGGKNRIAIEMIKAKMKEELQQKS